ncbi:hypothetical protein ABZ137_38535 [Streptomyces bobili]|uniref:hypothetical protein n=1 Tax=Streptomyces bobili TaxID=67280 RepID=UPI0033AFE574
MNASTLPSLFSGLAAAGSALADAPWWIAAAFLLPAFPAITSGIGTLITACSDARTRAIWDRHEDTYLTDPDRYRAGLDHIARVRQTIAAQPPAPAPAPATQSQPPAEPSPAPP